MADITAQEFQQDVNNASEWANGDENTTVTMRLGQQVRSPAKVIADIQADFNATQSGELTAQAVDAADRAETVADAAFVNADVYPDVATGLAAVADGKQFQVVEWDEIVRYRRDSASTQTEVARYPSAAAVDNALSELSDQVDSIPAKTDKAEQDLETFVDEFGAIIRRTDSNAEMYLPDMDDRSVQGAYSENRDSITEGSGFRSKDTIQVEDAEGNVTMRQDVTGGLFVTGLNGSVQAVTNQSVDKTIYFPTDDREKLHTSVKPLINDLVIEGRPFVKPPTSLVPNNYFVPNSFVNAFSTSEGQGLWLETPHHAGGLVHPYLLTMREPLQGYKYWFADTPHLSGAREENPCIWGTNSLERDKRRFDLIPNLSQPLGRPDMSGNYWNSDEEFVYDPTKGKLTLHWRGGIGNVQSKHRDTWNGIDWTDEVEISEEDAIGSLLSPATLYNPITDVWHRWGIPSVGILNHYTSDAFDGVWTLQKTQNINGQYGVGLWHMEIKFIGEKYVAMFNQRNEGSNLWFAVSDDGDNWTVGSPLLPEGTPCYKGTFEPEWDGDNLRFWVGWNAYTFPRLEGVVQYLYIEPTNWVDTTTLAEDI